MLTGWLHHLTWAGPTLAPLERLGWNVPVVAAWYRARGELRRRWRATVLLILLVGVAGGAVLTTVAGARRSSTAYDRFRDETLAADLDMAFADEDAPPPDLAEAEPMVRSIPQVVAVGHLDFPFLVPAGSGFYPYLDFLAAGGADAPDIDVPRVLDGRLPDPTAELEVAILDLYAREADIDVGERLEFESFHPD